MHCRPARDKNCGSTVLSDAIWVAHCRARPAVHLQIFLVRLRTETASGSFPFGSVALYSGGSDSFSLRCKLANKGRRSKAVARFALHGFRPPPACTQAQRLAIVEGYMNAPPILVSFSAVKYLLGAMSLSSGDAEGQSIIDLHGRNLPPVTSATELAVLFGYSPRFVMSIVNRPARHYREFEIRTGSKRRQISAPRVGLKVMQAWFGFHLARAVVLPESVHGFVPARSTITAARCHLVQLGAFGRYPRLLSNHTGPAC